MARLQRQGFGSELESLGLEVFRVLIRFGYTSFEAYISKDPQLNPIRSLFDLI